MPKPVRSMSQRAQIFSAFDALKGFRELLKEQEKVVVAKRSLSEDDYELLNRQIYQLEVGMLVRVVYFAQGEYLQKEGRIAKLNLDTRIIQIVKTRIDLRNIVEISFLD